MLSKWNIYKYHLVSGLDELLYTYPHFFLNLTGQDLLNLSINVLYKIHIKKLAYQEIILESLDYLRNFHYNLDREHTQCVIVCLWISCKVEEKQLVTAPVILNVVEVLDAAKKPFDRQVGQVLDDGNVKLDDAYDKADVGNNWTSYET